MTAIQRLTNLSATDPGLYLVALSAYIEHILNEQITAETFEHPNFGDKLFSLKRKMAETSKEYIPELQSFGGINHDRILTNGIRHNFDSISKEEALAATHRFIQFCRLLHTEEEDPLKSWNDRIDLTAELKDYENLKWEAFQAQRENRELLEQLETYQMLQDEKEQLEEDLKLTSANLVQLAQKGLKSEEKNKVLRDERQNLKLRLREAETKLKDFKPIQNYTEELKRMVFYTRTRRDYEQTLLRLSAEQKEVLERIPEQGDFLITGAAGTGKTFILMEALRRDIKSRKESLLDDGSLILLSYTRTLVKYNSYISTIMHLDSRPDDLISTVDSWFLHMLQKIHPGLTVDYKTLKNLCKETDCPDFLTPLQLEAELENFIYSSGYSREQYIDDMVGRRGMKTPLSKVQREEVWRIKENLEAKMFESGLVSKGYSRTLIAASLPGAEIDRIFIDEVQDISTLELKILKSQTRKGIVMAGDTGQSIYSFQSPYKHSGLKIQGHSSVLKTNFRSTRAIMELCQNFRDDEKDLSAFREGPAPELFTAEHTQELYSMLQKRLTFLINTLEYDPENIFILVPSYQFENKISQAVREAGFNSTTIMDRQFDFLESGKVRISTLHSSKGLDMPVVLLFLPRLEQGIKGLDEGTEEKIKKNLLYVSLTRTMDILNVFMKEKPEDELLKTVW
ncbi:UvrD-helicase domain-containing protein, partial [Oceanispirochaeta sp.]|uniref:UvrD-helicase domain-containing protein n=1 Tax=Oceanispirochaeta sp. TaxID=2035350 RepID=UPI0026018F03